MRAGHDGPGACRIISGAHHVSTFNRHVSAEARARRNGHAGAVFWLTGLSGAGKSTITVGAERELFDKDYQVYSLDGDLLRSGINADLGFSIEDRHENIRRAAAIAALMADAGLVVLAAFISPCCRDREIAREAAADRFHEVFVRAPLSVCEQRDPRGLYRKARAGLIPEFTGISSPYEPPSAPDLELDTERLTVGEAVDTLVRYVERHVPLNRIAAS